MEGRTRRFSFVMTTDEKVALENLARHEHSSAAAALRRLLWTEARKRGLLSGTSDKQQEQVASGDKSRDREVWQ